MALLISRRTAVLGAATLVAASGVRAQNLAANTVETASGTLRGVRADGVSSFKGVPYAATTAGANRFCPPVAAEAWAGVREAASFGASAPQLPASGDPLGAWYGALQPLSEDCLFLNVWTPDTAGKQPVMVWLHGGA